MNKHTTSEIEMLNEEIVLNELEWQQWLQNYTIIRGEAFLRILEEREKKTTQWKIS
ncbi:MAG: hypothetical protein HY960_11545 [Ignavibacteriae bacterium]|nr:hypothetical protein [Ignavibacteriota bacterium]